MKKMLFVANWKMYMSFGETIKFATRHFDDFVSLASGMIPPAEGENTIVLCPSSMALYPIIKMFNETKIKIGAQRCSPHIYGAFTGQDPARSVNEIGCSHCIIGHSEARREFRLSEEQVAQKFVHLLDYDVTPIVCIGETKEEFDSQKTLSALERQLSPIFEAIKTKTIVHDYITPYIAYEPIWSIGTGEVAGNQHLDMVFCWIAEKISKNFENRPAGGAVPQIKLLYGGSVTAKNSKTLKKIDKISGFLVGGASLDFQEFEKIVK
ncbi:MAG: hypothetical protein GWP06_18180 [Actinobacteria bacterium]|nr:hypothetical protein [Actinomycetota bacterium]